MDQALPEPIPSHPDHEFKSTDSSVRYIGYASRIPLMFKRVIRYFAYTSDVGESFRPIVHPRIVTASYALSWTYVLGDVSYEGYKEVNRGVTGAPLAQTVVKRGIFQAVASMAIPAFLIHSQVKIFIKVFQRVGRFQKWGPTTAGLALVPVLPYLIDEPVEHGLDYAFDKVWPNPAAEHSRSHHDKHD
eukprot:TRINITY_DN2837_c0_g1_i1.p1 TRINITY_DN2837_c0_g1~~TRINITY_DN2837_c0_g1_i1.p1  ORF type:complete len:188 (+),score=12.72 TRINITY_DN2837_c0_g1_i1:39-602(+)